MEFRYREVVFKEHILNGKELTKFWNRIENLLGREIDHNELKIWEYRLLIEDKDVASENKKENT